MKPYKKVISILSLLLAVVLLLSACGGPAGKIVKHTHTTYYYEDQVTSEEVPYESTETVPYESSERVTYESYRDTPSGSTEQVTYESSEEVPYDAYENVPVESEQTTVEETKTTTGETTTASKTASTQETEDSTLSQVEELKKKYPKEMPLLAEDEESFAYTIVYPEKVSNSLSSQIKTLRSNVRKGLEVEVTAVLDTSVAESKKELLIGKTNRKLSADLLNKLKTNRKNCADDFLIYAKSGKIAIVADTDSATIKAINWFSETFCASRRTWTYLREGYEFLYAPDYALPAITVKGTEFYKYSVVTPDRGEYVYGRAVDDLLDTVRKDLHFEMARETEKYASTDKEILIGDLSRKESKSITPGEKEYVIAVVGSKLIVKGSDSVCLYYGVKKLETLIAEAIVSGKALAFGNTYRFTGKVDGTDPSVTRLTFGDEFDGAGLADVWTGYDGGTSGDNSVLGGAIVNSGRSLCYLSDGILHMPTSKSAPDSKDFNESKITLKKDIWYRYGCLEVCAKMPLGPAHCAIWLNGLGEVDILENFSSENSFKSNIHKWFTQNTWDGTSNYAHTSLDGNAAYADARQYIHDSAKTGEKLNDDFHVYSLDWTGDYFRFAVDGKTYFRYDYKDNEDEVDFFRQQLYLILVCGIGSSSYGTKYVPELHDGKTYDFQVDYVRLYQNPSTDTLEYQ